MTTATRERAATAGAFDAAAAEPEAGADSSGVVELVRASLLHTSSRENHRQRPEQDRQIEAERPVVQVREIVAQLDLGLGRVVAGDLREPRQTRARRVPERVARDLPGEAVGE